jgi:hypothetical protein
MQHACSTGITGDERGRRRYRASLARLNLAWALQHAGGDWSISDDSEFGTDGPSSAGNRRASGKQGPLRQAQFEACVADVVGQQ